MAVKGIQGRLAARRASITDRVAAVADGHGNWATSGSSGAVSTRNRRRIARVIPDAVEVTGADTYAEKRGAVEGFTAGRIRVLVSKVAIVGFGLNFQHCHHMAFVGIGDSYEQYYQAIRRCWRFGQQHRVDVAIVVSEAETGVVQNVRRKEATADLLATELLAEMSEFERMEVCA
jgi:hypothetical protein